MESGLRPKDIQARVRAGAKVEELASEAGMSAAMVERFAAPVMAEREHVATTALTSTLRRGGETTSHRTLRFAVSERLGMARIDLDSVDWDSYRLADGRWAVTATYEVDGESRCAEFLYQPAGRFSVTGNDEARGLAGEKSWPPAGESALDEEPTVNLADEFALVRALETSPAHSPEPEPATDLATDDRADEPSAGVDDGPGPEDAEPETADDAAPMSPEAAADSPDEPIGVAIEVDEIVVSGFSEDASESELDRLFAMFDGPSGQEDTGPVYGGLSDAAAVPDVQPGLTLDAATALDVPVEPSLFDDDPAFAVPQPEEEPAPVKPRKRSRRSRVRSQPHESAEAAPQTANARPATAVEPETASAAQTQPAQDEPGAALSAETTADESASGSAVQAPAEPAASAPSSTADEASEQATDGPAETEATVEVVDEPAAPVAAAAASRTDDHPAGSAADDAPTAEDEAAAAPAKPAARKKKGRASVPSWDEIMFGSPRRR